MKSRRRNSKTCLGDLVNDEVIKKVLYDYVMAISHGNLLAVAYDSHGNRLFLFFFKENRNFKESANASILHSASR